MPKSNIVIHSSKKITGETETKNWYHSKEGKKHNAMGLQHQANVANDANSVNRQAHAENRGPNDQEIGNFIDRMQYKHGKPQGSALSKTSPSRSRYVWRNGRLVCVNDGRAQMGLPLRKIVPPWQK